MAILIEPLKDYTAPISDCKQKVLLYNTRAHNINHLWHALGIVDWTTVMRCDCKGDNYSSFLKVVKMQLASCVP